ncbi:MAG TPA: DUF3037 domain-containing protein [Rubricoccaceae bacterium]|nr:DUF3037 domain-containing protein [Rubricoccaceae bacterium]
MSAPEPYDYDWAVVRLVAHVHRECFENVGVVMHARRARYLGVRLCPPEEAAARCGLDPALVARYFDAYRRVGEADGAGALGLLPPSERFHWLTAPRSTALQTSPVHTGRTRDLPGTLDRLYRLHVGLQAV